MIYFFYIYIMLTNIIDPITKQSYKLLSKSGKRLLKYYVQAYQKGGILSEQERYALVKTHYSLPCKDTIKTLTTNTNIASDIKKINWQMKLNIEFPNYLEMLNDIDPETQKTVSYMWKDKETPGTFNETNKENFQNYYRLCKYATHLIKSYMDFRNKQDNLYTGDNEFAKDEFKKEGRSEQRRAFFKQKFITEGNLTSNKEFMLQLIEKDPVTFYYASNKLKGDREVVLAAVKHDGLAIEDASNELKSDIDIAKAAVKQNINALRDIDKSLKKDDELRQIAFEKNDYLAKIYLIMPDDELKERRQRKLMSELMKHTDPGNR